MQTLLLPNSQSVSSRRRSPSGNSGKPLRHTTGMQKCGAAMCPRQKQVNKSTSPLHPGPRKTLDKAPQHDIKIMQDYNYPTAWVSLISHLSPHAAPPQGESGLPPTPILSWRRRQLVTSTGLMSSWRCAKGKMRATPQHLAEQGACIRGLAFAGRSHPRVFPSIGLVVVAGQVQIRQRRQEN